MILRGVKIPLPPHCSEMRLAYEIDFTTRTCISAVVCCTSRAAMADAEVEQAPVEQGSIAEDVPALQEPAKKAFVKRTTKPSAENLREKVASLESTISDAKATIEKIRQEMDGRKRRREGDGESQGIRNQLQELRTQFQQVLVRTLPVIKEAPGRLSADHVFLVLHACIPHRCIRSHNSLRCLQTFASLLRAQFAKHRSRLVIGVIAAWAEALAVMCWARAATTAAPLASSGPRSQLCCAGACVSFHCPNLHGACLCLQAQKQAVRAELEGATKARDALRTQVRGMKGKMEYTTVEKIDEQMARLESRLQHTSMPLAEEKKVLEDIKKLRASRVRLLSL